MNRTIVKNVLLHAAMWTVGCVLCVTNATADDPAAQALIEQGSAHFQAGRYVEAAEAFERADTVVPSPLAAYNASVSYLYCGQCDAARRVLSRLIDRSPEIAANAEVRGAIQRLAREGDASPGRRCALINQLSRAVDTALGEETADDAREIDAEQFAQLAHQRYESGDYATAASLYDAAHGINPMLLDALFNAGMAYHLAGQHRVALDALLRVAGQSPERVQRDAAVAAAVAEANTAGDLDPAHLCELASRLRRAIANAAGQAVTASGSAARLYRIGEEYHRSREYEQAAVFFECCNLISPHANNLWGAASCRFRAGDWTAAMSNLDALLAAEPETAADEAVRRARQAIDDEPYADDDRSEVLVGRLRHFIELAETRRTAVSEESDIDSGG